MPDSTAALSSISLTVQTFVMCCRGTDLLLK